MKPAPPPDPPNKYSRARLFDAARRGDVGALRAELSLRGKRAFPKTLGEAALAAIVEGHAMAASLLLDHGAEMKWGLGEALAAAAREGAAECCAMLLDRGADVGYFHQKPLLEASMRGHIETVRLLLERGAKPDDATPYMAAVAHAAGQGHFDIVNLLLDRGARYGLESAFVLAARDPNGLPAMRRLLDLGAKQIDSALGYAFRARNARAAKLLVELGAKLSPGRAEFEAGLESADAPKLARLIRRAEREEKVAQGEAVEESKPEENHQGED